MNDATKANLTLGTPPGKLKQSPAAGAAWWVWLLMLLHVATLMLIIVALRHPNGVANVAPEASGGEDLRTVALSLEDRSLDQQAAAAWQQYLLQNPAAADRAEVLYRIGKLYLGAEQYGDGAAALVRAEQAAGDDRALKDKIGLQLITCLRRLGRYGEVGRELSRQVEAGADEIGKGTVLATVAGEPLTTSDLDRMIERRVDQELRMAGADDDAATRQMLLKRFSGAEVRQQMLVDLLRRELFTRRARELGIDRSEETMLQRQMVEDDLLAGNFERRQLAAIQPTRVDLEAFFAANRQRYQEPESAEVLCFELQPDEKAKDVLQGVETADDFRRLAAQRLDADADNADDLPTIRLTRGREDPQLGDIDSLLDMKSDTWTETPHGNGDQQYLVLIASKTPARTPEFDEIASRVEGEYRTRKRQEVLEQTFRDLMTRYEVQIQSPPPPTEPSLPADGDAEGDQ